MSVLPDNAIASLCAGPKPMISPFWPSQVRFDERGKILSWGLSSAGYDIRLQPMFRIFDAKLAKEHGIAEIDPMKFDERCLRDVEADSVLLPPGTGLLGTSVEKFDIPDNIVGRCWGKSTLARCLMVTLVTPCEPGWIGELTVEVTNGGPLPLRVHARMGIAQLSFETMTEPASVSYAKRDGKYQGQAGITVAKL